MSNRQQEHSAILQIEARPIGSRPAARIWKPARGNDVGQMQRLCVGEMGASPDPSSAGQAELGVLRVVAAAY